MNSELAETDWWTLFLPAVAVLEPGAAAPRGGTVMERQPGEDEVFQSNILMVCWLRVTK